MIFVSAKAIHMNINLLVNFVYIRDDNNFYPPTVRIKRRIMSFADRYGPWTLILGASEGTGRAFARKIAANGVPSILIARREAPLLALAKEIHAESGGVAGIPAANGSAPAPARRPSRAAAGGDAHRALSP